MSRASIALCLALSLVACGKDDDKSSSKAKASQSGDTSNSGSVAKSACDSQIEVNQVPKGWKEFDLATWLRADHNKSLELSSIETFSVGVTDGKKDQSTIIQTRTVIARNGDATHPDVTYGCKKNIGSGFRVKGMGPLTMTTGANRTLGKIFEVVHEFVGDAVTTNASLREATPKEHNDYLKEQKPNKAKGETFNIYRVSENEIELRRLVSSEEKNEQSKVIKTKSNIALRYRIIQ